MSINNQFDNINIRKRKACQVCGSTLDAPVIELPEFPLTEIYVERKYNHKVGFIDQEFHLCEKCGHGQIVNVLDPIVLYGQSYKTRTSTSSSAIAAVDVFLLFVKRMIKGRRIGTVLEIGCNDLYTLNKLKDKAQILYGIDPILKGKRSNDKKIRIIGDFIENIDIKSMGLDIDLVISSHTLEHIEVPKEMIKNLIALGSKNTLYVFQFPGLETLVNQCHFDQVFHQHLNYFSLKSIIYMLDDLDAELVDYEVNPYHWGALMISFKKRQKGSNYSNNKFRAEAQKITRQDIRNQYSIFKQNMEITSKRLHSFENSAIYGYGAALMLPVLGYYIKGLDKISRIIDEDPDKNGLYYLNFPVKIQLPNTIKNIKDATVIVTAINSMQAVRAIVNKLIKINVRQILLPTNLI